jgi:cardiolipin synthase
VTAYVADPSALLPNNRVQLLRDGAEAYPRMLAAIGAAQHSVLVEMYTFASDETGWSFAKALAARARAGVQVRVLYDAAGSKETSTELWSHIRTAGGAVTPYRPLIWFSVRKRDHRKLVIVDGRVAFAGGLNIADEYALSWRDTHLEVEGPAVGDLVELFRQTWEAEEDDPLWRPNPPPAPGPAGLVPVGVFSGNRWRDRRSIAAAYLHAIRAARSRLWISNAYFMPSAKFLRALRKADRRGVDVRLLVPRRTDAWPVYFASRYLFSGLLWRGVRIFEWKGPMLHAKTAVVDGVWCTIGSYNLDHLSFARNLELSLVAIDPVLGAAMESMHVEDLKNADEVTRAEWKKRPWSQRGLEWFWHLFQSAL